MLQHLAPHHGYMKKIATRKDSMIFVTYYKYWLKCYLNVFTTFMIVPKRMGSTNVLANAIGKFKLFFNYMKKINKNHLFSSTYSVINSMIISLIVVCFLAAITFSCVLSSLSIFMCNFSFIIITSLKTYTYIFMCFNIYINMLIYICIYNNIYILD